ncbi:MAG: hypothetical protein QMC26_01600 [Pseudomonadales bacterium]
MNTSIGIWSGFTHDMSEIGATPTRSNLIDLHRNAWKITDTP